MRPTHRGFDNLPMTCVVIYLTAWLAEKFKEIVFYQFYIPAHREVRGYSLSPVWCWGGPGWRIVVPYSRISDKSFLYFLYGTTLHRHRVAFVLGARVAPQQPGRIAHRQEYPESWDPGPPKATCTRPRAGAYIHHFSRGIDRFWDQLSFFRPTVTNYYVAAGSENLAAPRWERTLFVLELQL